MSLVRARTIWLKVHRYLALTVGAFIAVMGLSGSVISFYLEVDRLLNPALQVYSSEAPRVSADFAVERAEEYTKLKTAFVRLPRYDHAVYVVELPDPRVGQNRVIAVSAITGEVLANRIWGSTLATFFMNLHTTLLMGEPGVVFTSVLACVLMASAITGLWLWWPRVGSFRRALSFRPSRTLLPFTFELHRISGVYLAVVLLIIGFTGVYLATPSVFMHPAKEPPPHSSSTGPRISISEVQRIMRERVPNKRVSIISLPRKAGDTYEVQFECPDEPQSRNGRSTAWIDASTGAVLKSRAYSALSRTDRFFIIQRPVHGGYAFGTPGRTVACLAGLATFVLYISGLYLWWKRRPARRINARAPPPRPTASFQQEQSR